MGINTTVKLDLTDGTQIEMTMTYGKLLKARSKYKDAYDAYNMVEMGGAKDIFSFIDVVYMGYLCQNIDAENVMDKATFMDRITPNRDDLLKAYRELVRPKKK